MRHHHLLLLLALALSALQPFSPSAFSQTGHLVIIGGANKSPEIVERIVSLAGGPKRTRVLIVPFAMNKSAEKEGAKSRQLFLDAGCENIDVILAPRSEIDSEENLARLDGVNVVYFSGGYQKLLSDHLLGTKFLEKIRRIYEEGGVVSGTSAGAAVMSDTMLGGEGRKGFGFLPKHIVIHQHFIVRKRLMSIVSALIRQPDLTGVGIDESTAIVVNPRENMFEVLGASKVMVFETVNRPDKKTPSFKVRLLSSGDKCKM